MYVEQKVWCTRSQQSDQFLQTNIIFLWIFLHTEIQFHNNFTLAVIVLTGLMNFAQK